jgi:Putative restriction endonuclease
MVTTTLVTAKELERLDDGYRYELIAGELIRMTPAKPKHSWVGNRFAARLTVVVEANDLGDVFDSSAGYQFAENPDTILAPDVSFIRKERVPPVAEWDDYFRVAPRSRCRGAVPLRAAESHQQEASDLSRSRRQTRALHRSEQADHHRSSTRPRSPYPDRSG